MLRLATIMLLLLAVPAMAESESTRLMFTGEGDTNQAFITTSKTKLKKATCWCSGAWLLPPELRIVDMNTGRQHGRTFVCSTGELSAEVVDLGRMDWIPAGVQIAFQSINTSEGVREAAGLHTDRMQSVTYATCMATVRYKRKNIFD